MVAAQIARKTGFGERAAKCPERTGCCRRITRRAGKYRVSQDWGPPRLLETLAVG